MNQNSPIKDCLVVLNRHADVIELGLSSGSEINGASAPAQSIAALRQAMALRPSGEDGYRLHPRLREYLQDLMQTFPAYQSLAEIGSKVSQLAALWSEIDSLRGSVDRSTVEQLVDLLQTTVHDIGYAVDRNILMLQTRLSTRYGNVSSLQAKQSQNRWYQKQTTHLSGDLSRLAAQADRLERDASTRRMEGLATFLRRHLLGRILPWQESLSEMQSLIRKELFKTRQLEANHRHLAQMDMMLRQQPGWRGFEAGLTAEIPDILLAAVMPAFKPHAEPLDGDRQMADEMERLARTLAPREVAVEEEPAERKKITRDPPRAAPSTPGTEALGRLLAHVRAADVESFSLLRWRKGDKDAQTMSPETWLVFAIMALRGRQHLVSLVRNDPRPGEKYAHSFGDAMVVRRARVRTSPKVAA